MKDQKIGVAGVGMVGGAFKQYFEEKGITPFLYDPGKKLGSLDELNRADIIFLCVPTPSTEGGCDTSYVEGVCAELKEGKIVVIKSTVIPGTTERMQKQFPHLIFLFSPEFLVEAQAYETLVHADRQIIGVTEQSKGVAKDVLALLPEAPFTKVMSATEAEMVKYFGNTFLSLKVIFASQMHDLCERLGIDYAKVAEAAGADPRINPSHLDVWHGGYKGFGGKCFPKDTRALLALAEKEGVDLSVLKEAEVENLRLMKKQGIDDPESVSRTEF